MFSAASAVSGYGSQTTRPTRVPRRTGPRAARHVTDWQAVAPWRGFGLFAGDDSSSSVLAKLGSSQKYSKDSRSGGPRA